MAEEKKGCDEDCAKQLEKLLERMNKELDKAAKIVNRAGKQAYDTMPKEIKTAGKRMNDIANAVASDVAEDMPKIEREIDNFGRRMEKYARDVRDAMRAERKNNK